MLYCETILHNGGQSEKEEARFCPQEIENGSMIEHYIFLRQYDVHKTGRIVETSTFISAREETDTELSNRLTVSLSSSTTSSIDCCATSNLSSQVVVERTVLSQDSTGN